MITPPRSLSPRRFWLTIVLPVLGVGALLVLLLLRLLIAPRVADAPGADGVTPAARPVTAAPARPMARPQGEGRPPIGVMMLEKYGSESQSPKDDLSDVAHVLANFRLLAKGDRAMSLGSNAEIATALRGESAARTLFVPAGHRVMGQGGQLVDRWGTPLFFHVESADQIDVRSAGPDREMWTADDLHRRADGSFLEGAELNPPSLHMVKSGTAR